MKHFINLSSRVINKLHIIEIIKNPNKYLIHMNNYNKSGCLITGSGTVHSNSNIIEICKRMDQQDYDNITKLIKNIKS